MSDEQQAQADKNTKDIRTLKYQIPLIWFIGILISGGSFVWAIATYSANKANSEINFRADQIRQNQEIKAYFDVRLQQLRTKDSTDISNYHIDFVNQISIYRLTISDEIKLLREEYKRTSGVLMHTYDKNGNIIPGVDKIVNR